MAGAAAAGGDRKSTRLNSSHLGISYAVFCLKKKKEGRNTMACCTAPLERKSTLLTALHDARAVPAPKPARVRRVIRAGCSLARFFLHNRGPPEPPLLPPPEVLPL